MRIEAGGEADASTPQELPRALLFSLALTCGLFLALVVHIALGHANAGLASMWRDLFPASANQLKSALAWWAIGGAGCLGSWGTILLLRHTSAGEPAQRFLRLGLAAIFFCLLAAAGHAAASAPAAGAAATTAANLGAMSLGGFMAFCAAHFALRRH
jgi:hypothetical protein